MTTIKRTKFFLFSLVILLTGLLSSCNESQIKIESIKRKVSSGGGAITVKSVDVVNNQLVISGTNLSSVTGVKVTGPSSFDETFSIESKSESQLLANSTSNLTVLVNWLSNLIVSNAEAAATYTINFELQDEQITAAKLNDMGALSGDVLTYDGTSWGPSPLSGLSFKGTFDATAGDQTTTAIAARHYYIVTVAGTNDPDGGSDGNTYALNDWA